MSRSPQILFPVAVTPEALLKFVDQDHKQTHRTAAILVQRHGILRFGSGDEQKLHDAIGSLPNGPANAWSNAIQALKGCHRFDAQTLSEPVADFLATGSRQPGSAEQVRLALVAQGTGARSAKLNATERVTLPNIEDSRAVSGAQAIGTFPVGTRRTQIAEQLITPLATLSRQVRIMDPHLLEPLIEDPKARPDHIRWLLEVLGQAMPEGATIWLIGTLQNRWKAREGPDNDETRLAQFVRAALIDRKEALTVEVRLVQALSQALKNRYLWFDCTDPFDVLHNFVPLEHDTLKEELRIIRQGGTDHRETERLAGDYEPTEQKAKAVIVTVSI